jgi:S-adenosylmethionine:tRNA ribosyltransferase-isomerase
VSERGHLRVADFDFHLPEELIAQQPPAERDAARMLVLDRASGAIDDKDFRDLPTMLGPGDLLVLNDSRVIPARLFATRAGAASQKQEPTGKIEVLLTQQLGPEEWSALVRPGKKVQVGERLFFAAEDGKPLL